jgi:hypothetical protein
MSLLIILETTTDLATFYTQFFHSRNLLVLINIFLVPLSSFRALRNSPEVAIFEYNLKRDSQHNCVVKIN